MINFARWEPYLIVGLGLLIAAISETTWVIRPYLVLAYLLFVPGFACVRLIGLRKWWLEIALALGLSIALDTLIAEALLLAHWWSASLAMWIVVNISIVAAYFLWQRDNSADPNHR